MSSAPLAQLAQLVPDAGRAWLVGGAVRDELLGRSTLDYDVAVEGDARRLARRLGRSCSAHSFALSETFGAWRVIAADQSWQVDLTPLTGETLEQDLRRRDLTVNAIARPIGGDGPVGLIDPAGGVADLHARTLRMIAPDAFASDPLRTIRLARLAAELDFAAEPLTVATAAASAPGLAGVAPERVFAELRQLIISERAPAGLALLDRIGATAVVLPELSALHGVEQSDYHHLDVYDHTIATLRSAIELERDPAAVFGDELGEQVAALLAEPLANELSRGGALRLGALFHDIAKPVTRAVTDRGRVTFFGHDAAGAELAHAILMRLRTSERLAGHVAALSRNHLRLGFLVHERPVSRRDVYRYLARCEPVEVDVTVLSVADRLATLGRNSERAVELHLELARELLADAFAWRRQRPRPPIRGDQLADALELEPGPLLGQALEELSEAAYAGEIDGPEQAIAHARAWIAAER